MSYEDGLITTLTEYPEGIEEEYSGIESVLIELCVDTDIISNLTKNNERGNIVVER